MKKTHVMVLKFGGSSMGSVDAVTRVIDIMQNESRTSPIVSVVSAMAGVTDSLIQIGVDSLNGKRRNVESNLKHLHRLHDETFSALAKAPATHARASKFLERCLGEMRTLAHGILLLGEFTERTRDKLTSYGEILSSNLLAQVMADRNPRFCHSDARDWIVAERTRQGIVVDTEETERRLRVHLEPLLRRGLSPVVPGFICRSPDGQAATLGRNGSDYSAAIVGAALGAREISIYTDVDGIMTADPGLVAEAAILPQISYQEAAEMSYFGAKVLHPKTMIPAVLRHVPIRIKNTFNPAARGTLVTEQSGRRPLVKTVTAVRDLAMLNVQGNGMIGIPGVASRLFEVLAHENVNIMMISQSSSEHSVCLVIQASDADIALRAICREFQRELENNFIEGVDLVRKAAIISIIGSGMRGTPGISGKFFDALGKCRINVLAIAQGSSELNISAAILEKDVRHAVQAIHSAFGLTRDLNVFLFGCGTIGRTLLRYIHENRPQLARKLEVNLKVLGVANSRSWCFSPGGLQGSTLEALGSGAPLDQIPGSQPRPAAKEILERIAGTYKSDVVLVDATAADLASTHIMGLESGFHIVTANKKPLTTSLKQYQTIQRVSRRRGLNYQYEATFGAGLPLLSSLQDLLNTGDHILGIQGCLSGTLGFICSRLDADIPLSQALSEAMELGYTEPDPREDLSGTDVARKSLIISRALGAAMDMQQVRLKAMIPRRFFRAASVAQFLHQLPAADVWMREEIEKARAEDKVLRYLADIDARECSIGLKRVPRNSPIGRLAGPDNILVFRTQRYHDNPLVIQGPGAGASVTAAGVLSDLLKIAKWI